MEFWIKDGQMVLAGLNGFCIGDDCCACPTPTKPVPAYPCDDGKGEWVWGNEKAYHPCDWVCMLEPPPPPDECGFGSLINHHLNSLGVCIDDCTTPVPPGCVNWDSVDCKCNDPCGIGIFAGYHLNDAGVCILDCETPTPPDCIEWDNKNCICNDACGEGGFSEYHLNDAGACIPDCPTPSGTCTTWDSVNCHCHDPGPPPPSGCSDGTWRQNPDGSWWCDHGSPPDPCPSYIKHYNSHGVCIDNCPTPVPADCASWDTIDCICKDACGVGSLVNYHLNDLGQCIANCPTPTGICEAWDSTNCFCNDPEPDPETCAGTWRQHPDGSWYCDEGPPPVDPCGSGSLADYHLNSHGICIPNCPTPSPSNCVAWDTVDCKCNDTCGSGIFGECHLNSKGVCICDCHDPVPSTSFQSCTCNNGFGWWTWSLWECEWICYVPAAPDSCMSGTMYDSNSSDAVPISGTHMTGSGHGPYWAMLSITTSCCEPIAISLTLLEGSYGRIYVDGVKYGSSAVVGGTLADKGKVHSVRIDINYSMTPNCPGCAYQYDLTCTNCNA